MKWMLKRYMVERHIETLGQLADTTGIARRTLYDRINNPRTIKLYELAALDKVLHFTDEDLVRITRGEF